MKVGAERVALAVKFPLSRSQTAFRLTISRLHGLSDSCFLILLYKV